MVMQSFKKAVTFMVDENEFNLMEQMMEKGIKRKEFLRRGIESYAAEFGIEIIKDA